MPKIKICFAHSKNSARKYAELSAYFFNASDSTGPLVQRGESYWMALKAQEGDVVEFSTTKYDGDFDLKIYREGKVFNSSSWTPRKDARKRVKETEVKK